MIRSNGYVSSAGIWNPGPGSVNAVNWMSAGLAPRTGIVSGTRTMRELRFRPDNQNCAND